MTEQTLLVIKPDAVKKGLAGYILKRFEDAGFRIKALRMLKLEKKFMERFYSHLKPKLNSRLFGNIVGWMCSGSIVVAVVECKNAVAKARQICGNTNPVKAKKGTIRALSADDLEKRAAQNKATRNLIHASGSREEAKREIAMFEKILR